jgi:hypothetical protein
MKTKAEAKRVVQWADGGAGVGWVCVDGAVAAWKSLKIQASVNRVERDLHAMVNPADYPHIALNRIEW